MEIHRNCRREEMTEVISDACRQNASRQNKLNSIHTHTHTHTIYPTIKLIRLATIDIDADKYIC